MLLKNESADMNGVGGQLLSLHNLAHMLQLSRDMRTAIIEQRFGDFVREFMCRRFPDCNYPTWVLEAMQDAGIELKGVVSATKAK